MKEQSENRVKNERKIWCKPMTKITIIDDAGFLCASTTSVTLQNMENGGELEEENW